MKTKLEMAHEYALQLSKNPSVTATHNDKDIASRAWDYADAMQAEADKRLTEVDHKEEWQPDWSQTPDAKYWAMDSSGFADWFSDEPELDSHSFVGNRLRSALQYGYTGDWRDSLRKRPQ